MSKERTAHAIRCGENLRACRERCGLSQEKLAELTGPQPTGFSTNYIGMLERGERTMNPKAARKLAKALNDTKKILVSPAFLLGEIKSLNEMEEYMPVWRQEFERQKNQAGTILYLLSLYGMNRVGVIRLQQERNPETKRNKTIGLDYVSCDKPTDCVDEHYDYHVFLGSDDRGENQSFIINGHQFNLLKQEISTFLNSRIAIYDELTRNSDLFSDADALAVQLADEKVNDLLCNDQNKQQKN